MPVIDRSGQPFHRWTVLRRDTKKDYWVCQCVCGEIRAISMSNLLSGRSKSCGCFNSEESSKRMMQYHVEQGIYTPEEKTEAVKRNQQRYRDTHRAHINRHAAEAYAADPQKFLKRTKRWRQEHRQPRPRKARPSRYPGTTLRQYMALWRSDNARSLAIYSAMYRLAHPEKHRAAAQRRRAAKANAPMNDFTEAQWTEVAAAANGRCAYCPENCWRCKRKKHKLTQEHVTPYAHNGSNTLWNVIAVCQSCNSRKRDKVVPPKAVQMVLLTIAPAKPLKQKGPSPWPTPSSV